MYEQVGFESGEVQFLVLKKQNTMTSKISSVLATAPLAWKFRVCFFALPHRNLRPGHSQGPALRIVNLSPFVSCSASDKVRSRILATLSNLADEKQLVVCKSALPLVKMHRHRYICAFERLSDLVEQGRSLLAVPRTDVR